jgi:hypothetical protein
MTELNPKSPDRMTVDSNIKARLNFSKWFSRGALAVAVAAGSYIGVGGKDNINGEVGFPVGISAAVGAYAERRQAKKTVDKDIIEYAERANTNGSGYSTTVLTITGTGFAEETQYDRTIPFGFSHASGVIASSAGGLGAVLLGSGLSGEALKSATTTVDVFGGVMVGFGVAFLGVDKFAVREELQIGEQRLDNIDNGLRFGD